jgi:hypothetical protein
MFTFGNVKIYSHSQTIGSIRSASDTGIALIQIEINKIIWYTVIPDYYQKLNYFMNAFRISNKSFIFNAKQWNASLDIRYV